VLLATLALASSCQTSPPVQEMSDARQAIAVAIEAGAEDNASAALRSAQAFLDSAQRNLTERAYDLARRDARQAKNKALEALAEAEKARE